MQNLGAYIDIDNRYMCACVRKLYVTFYVKH